MHYLRMTKIHYRAISIWQKRLGDYVILDLSTHETNDLVGWVAGEANHSKSAWESDVLNSACDAIEASI